MVCLQIINKVLKSKSADIIINNDLTEQHFVGYEAYYNFIMDHYRRYGNVPDIATFLESFEDFQLVDVTETDSYLVDKINEEYLYAQMVPLIQQTASMLTNGNSGDALDFLKSQILPMTMGCAAYGTDIVANGSKRYEEWLLKHDSDEPFGYTTGFPELDEPLGRLAPGEEFLVIVARTNQGKSWILLKIATHLWKLGLNVGYISPEMSDNQIGYRFDALNEHYSQRALFRGEDVENYREYIEDLSTNHKNKFIVAQPIDFNRRITVSKLRNFVNQCGLDALFIDGITDMTDERGKKGDNKTTSLTNISEDIMELSVELKIPICVVVQANRSGVGTDTSYVPELESIRDSDGISHNATKVISIRQKNNRLYMEIKKNRNGPVNNKFIYNWNIDIGEFEYDSSPTEFVETEESENRFSGNDGRGGGTNHSQPKPPNRQPVTRRSINTNVAL